jgi:hypothetical protein
VAATFGTERQLESERGAKEGVVDLKDFTYYVHYCSGEVEEIKPATGLRLTGTEVIFLLGECVVAHVPRKDVYYTGREQDAQPVML